EASLVEWLQQVIDGAHLERLERIRVVGRDEYQRRKLAGFQGARKLDAVQRIHLNVEEQQLRLEFANTRERGGAVAILTDHLQVLFRLAQLAQRASSGRFVIDDDDVHQAPTKGADRRA